MFWKKKKENIYLDFAAATPARLDLLEEYNKSCQENFVNPGGLFRRAEKLSEKIVEYKNEIKSSIFAKGTDKVIFTRGGTEANNLAIQGIVYDFLFHQNVDYIPHVIVSEIEHASVLETIKKIAERGLVKFDLVPVEANGKVNIQMLEDLIRPETILICVMLVNNETGVIQPVKEIAKVIRRYRKEQGTGKPYFHSDAIQAVNVMPIRVDQLGVDTLTISGSKIFGPRSVAMLFATDNTPLRPVILGGSQENHLRAGTEDFANIQFFVNAFKVASRNYIKNSAHYTKLWKYLSGLIDVLNSEFNNRIELIVTANPDDCVPNIFHIFFKDISGERLVIELDSYGIEVSSMAACKSHDDEMPVVIASIKQSRNLTGDYGTLRISFGPETRKSDLKMFEGALREILAKIINEKQIYNS